MSSRIRPHPLARFPAVAIALSWLAGGCGGPPAESALFSMLAVGDAGAPPSNGVDYPRMLAVAAGMAAEDRERPVDALLVLGDNFYPSGLRRDALVPRIRANVVRPFCHFIAVTATRYGEVGDACQVAPNARHPVPIFAVLGNHDYASPESPHLQRELIPQFVANWRMPTGPAETVELPGGVSLVLFDSEVAATGGSTAPLVVALRAARGPWRIVASHRPIATRGALETQRQNADYTDRVREAIARAGVSVQLVLSGHEHRLAVLTMAAPDPPLHVISGGGSDRRKNRTAEPNTRAEFKSLGYVRVDRIGSGPEARLMVSIVRVHRYAWVRLFAQRQLAARWSVDREGRVREE